MREKSDNRKRITILSNLNILSYLLLEVSQNGKIENFLFALIAFVSLKMIDGVTNRFSIKFECNHLFKPQGRVM